jgi:hypothetical protein
VYNIYNRWHILKFEGLPYQSLSKDLDDPPNLLIRSWSQAAIVVSFCEFPNSAIDQHRGIPSAQRFGVDTDDDGVENEMTRATVRAATLQDLFNSTNKAQEQCAGFGGIPLSTYRHKSPKFMEQAPREWLLR